MAQMRVRYKGAADRRVLPADELAARGIKGIDQDLVFEPSNFWSMTLDMSEELENILREDGSFSLEALTDEGDTKLESDATVSDDTADTVVMADTGQVDKKK